MAERLLTAAVECLERIDKIRKVFVFGQKIKIASDGLFDVSFKQGDDQLVLALEIRIKRPRAKPAAAAMASIRTAYLCPAGPESAAGKLVMAPASSRNAGLL